MVKSLIKCIGMTFVSILILTSCSLRNSNSISVVRKNDLTQINKDLEYLTSDICDGRKPGTIGNENAADYIIERYKEIGLEPFGTDYESSFIKEIETLVMDQIKLELLDGDNVLESYTYGNDFIEILVDNVDFILPLVDYPLNTECVVLAEDLEASSQYKKNPNVKLIIRKYKEFKRTGTISMKDITPEIGVQSELFDSLKSQVGKLIHFSADVNSNEATLNNIVGYIKGQDNSKALIISAHFDHVGSVGNKIWRGALDNASGICTLLYSAQIINEYYKDTIPPYDIIFCAFNSEEGIDLSKAGSSYFVKQINETYNSVFDINIDCLGNKDYISLFVISNDNKNSSMLKDNLIKFMKNSQIGPVIEYKGEYGSDHKNFENAICLTTISDLTTSSIHTLNDTIDKIDTSYLLRVGGSLAEFITKDLNIEELFLLTNNEDDTDTDYRDSGQVSLSGDGNISSDELTVQVFEELYQCELDFADETLRSIRIKGSRPFLRNQLDNNVNKGELTLWNVRHLTLYLDKYNMTIDDDAEINFITYIINDPNEMAVKKYELEGNGYKGDFMTHPISVDNIDYYLAEDRGGSYGRPLSTFVENDEMIIWVSIYFPLIDQKNLEHDDYRKLLMETVPSKYIIGISDLMLNSTR